MQSAKCFPGAIHRRSCHPYSGFECPVRLFPCFCGLEHSLINQSNDRYYHRCINIPKLVDVRFTSVPPTMTQARMIRLHKLPDKPRLLEHGLREMEERDVPQVTSLFGRYMKRFGMAPVYDEADIAHQFLSGRGEGPRGPDSWKTLRDGQVVWTYVVEVSPFARLSNLVMRRPSLT